MLPTRNGSIKLFRLFGIDVFLHWSWLLVAVYEIESRRGNYSSVTWNTIEYLALFLIVLTHEFGHALACRSVGGMANQIVLWPLGGVAYVQPPPRPGATLWSIAAGPLVNVVLVPVLYGLYLLGEALNWWDASPDLHHLIVSINEINLALLIFNMLPIYPTDGGQILRSLLWFAIGPAQSLLVATGIGFVGVAGLAGFALFMQSGWLGILAVFIGLNCWSGLQVGLAMRRLANAPRRAGFSCPSCHAAPPQGPFWMCGQCRQAFDTFETLATCPHCGTQYNATRCLDCGALNPIANWATSPPHAGTVPPQI